MRRLNLAAAAGLVSLGLAACSDDSIYSSGGDPATRRAARAVVAANLTALARGDARTFCASYTPRFLREYRGSYARCLAAFKGPPQPRAPAPRIVWRDFLTSGRTKVDVQFTTAGSSVQSYYLEYRRPDPHVGRTPRWLIDQEAVERE